MALQRARDLLLKIASGTGFVTVAGLRARRIALNAQVVDATDAGSAGRWRELLAQASVRRASISGSGVFLDAQADELARAAFFAAGAAVWRIAIPDFGVIEGEFAIATLEYRGGADGELGFEIALESAGALSFEAA